MSAPYFLNMQIMYRNLILLVCAFLPASLQATDNNGHFAIWGKGNNSCYSYTTAHDNDELDPYKHFVMGYLTGYNVQTPETYRMSGTMNLSQILGWLYDYCESSPIIGFEQALADFIAQHFDKRMKHAPVEFRR